jgi:hypothetical protein
MSPIRGNLLEMTTWNAYEAGNPLYFPSTEYASRTFPGMPPNSA